MPRPKADTISPRAKKLFARKKDLERTIRELWKKRSEVIETLLVELAGGLDEDLLHFNPEA